MQLDLPTSISIMVFLGALTPFLTAILTRLRDPDWFKGIVSIFGTVGVGVLASFEQSGWENINLETTLWSAGATLAVHLMSYFSVTDEMVRRLAKATVKFAPVALKRGPGLLQS